MMEVVCKQCFKKFNKKLSEIEKFPNHFCSRSCAASYNNKATPKRRKRPPILKNCCNCGTTLKRAITAASYCSTGCVREKNYKTYLLKYFRGEVDGTVGSNYQLNKYVKRYVLERDKSCVICGVNNFWQGKKLTLQIDHIDGDVSNANLDNLRVVCPNCHSQTHTYGSKNKNTKRKRYLGKL
jgi:hypothetical protein